MTRVLLPVAGLLALVGALGCRPDSDPPPRFAEQAGGYGVPIQVLRRVGDRSVVASAQPEDAPPSKPGKSPGASTETKVKIDDSTPEAAAQTLADLSASGDLVSLPGILVPEQQEPMRQLAEASQPLLQSCDQLRKVLDAKLPGHGIQIGRTGLTAATGMVKKLTVVSVKVDPNDKNQASAAMETPAGQTETLRLLRIEGHWRVQLPAVPKPEDLQKGRQLMEALTEGIRTLTSQIEAGQITDKAAVQTALNQALAKAVGASINQLPKGAGQPTPQDKPSSSETTAKKPPAESAAPRRPGGRKAGQREEVDDVYSGPGQLRGR